MEAKEDFDKFYDKYNDTTYSTEEAEQEQMHQEIQAKLLWSQSRKPEFDYKNNRKKAGGGK